MSAETFRALVALGLDNDQIAGVLELVAEREAAAREEGRATVEKVLEGNREQARARWRKWNDKRLQTLANDSKHSTRGKDNLLPKKISGKDSSDASPSAQPSKGSRIPANFSPDLDWSVGEGLSPAEARHEAAQFCDYWSSKSGKDALKADWPKTWQVWVRNSIKRRPPQRGSPPAGPARPTNAAQLSRQELLNPERNDHGSDRTARLLDAGDRTQRGAGSGPSGGYAFTAYGRA